MSERLIVVEPVPGTLLAETKDEAKRIRVNELLPALERGEIVTLDFSKVGFATQSYVHALISEAIRRYGDQAFDLLRFKGCSEEVQQVVLTVFEYTIAAGDAAAGLDFEEENPRGEGE